MRYNQIIDNQKISIQQQKELLNTNRMMYNSLQQSNQLLQNIFTKENDIIQKVNNLDNKMELKDFLSKSNEADLKAIRESTDYLSFAEKQNRLSNGKLY